MKDFIKHAAHVKPSANQLRLLTETPFYAFVHFSPNTYTNLEWGTGDEDPSIFNPVDLDCDGWCKAIKSAGMKGVVITAKHHDGFCLWQTKYTDHSMKKSPYRNGKGDIVKELSEACRRHGLKFGFYLSPWDRHSELYGTDEYNVYYKAQLTELLTNYGEIFHVWFDGACGEGPNGKKQVYDFDGYFELIHKYQPNATVFNDRGPVRWCGNEDGSSRHAEWAVVPSELCPNCEIQTEPGPFAGDLSYMYNMDENIGSLSNIIYSRGLVFAPSEVDMSIRPGWFYHENEEPYSLDRLFDTYLRSVGGNTTFILNIPPKPDGTFDEKDVVRLKELGEKIRESFSVNIAEGKVGKMEPYKNSDTQCTVEIDLKKEETIHFVEVSEDIARGQRIENFFVQRYKDNRWENCFEGTTVGARKIVRFDEGLIADRLRIFVTAARDMPEFKRIAIY